MNNLDSILKSRDITLPANVHLIKAMVFPVVMYRCESWTIKKVEHQRIDAFELWYWIIFEIASKYYISDSFVDYEGYSISSKGFLPTVVDNR